MPVGLKTQDLHLATFADTVSDLLLLGIKPEQLLHRATQTFEEQGYSPGAGVDADLLLANAKIRKVVDRLIAQGAQDGPLDPQAKAMECQILFKSGYRTQGALSTTEEGTLRLLAPGEIRDTHDQRGPGKRILAEHFFDYQDIEAIVVIHEIPPVSSLGGDRRIIMPNGS